MMQEELKGKTIRPTASTFFEEMPDDKALLMNSATGHYHSLNPVAAAMWSALIRSDSTDEAVQVLLAKYDVDPETLWQDLSELLEDLGARGLVEITDS
jgi:hypothetical protein